MEAVPALIWIARTPDCRVISGNNSSYEILRLPHDSNLSMSAPPGEHPTNFRVFSEGRALSPEEMPVQRAARGEEVQNFEEEVRFDDGSSRHIFGNATPLRDVTGEVVGAVAAAVDITGRKQAEEALQESERRLQLALDAGHMGAWEWNLETGAVIWSPGLEALHRVEPGTFGGTLADFKRDIHPDDLPLIEREMARAIETEGDYHVVYRAQLPDGTIRWMEAFGQLSPRNGPKRRLTGVCMWHPGLIVGSIRVSRREAVENAAILQNFHNVLEISPLFIAKPALSNFRNHPQRLPVQNNNILVVGGAGYIGSHTCLQLAAKDYQPVVYDNLSNGHEEFVKWGVLEKGDIRDRQRLDEVLARHKPRAILHFAAML